MTLLAAGETMLAFNVGTAYQFSLILGSVAFVVISIVMLRSGSFSRPTAALGILANVLAFGLELPVMGTYVLLFSTVLLLGWHVLIATGFVRFGLGSAFVDAVRGLAPWAWKRRPTTGREQSLEEIGRWLRHDADDRCEDRLGATGDRVQLGQASLQGQLCVVAHELEDRALAHSQVGSRVGSQLVHGGRGEAALGKPRVRMTPSSVPGTAAYIGAWSPDVRGMP